MKGDRSPASIYSVPNTVAVTWLPISQFLLDSSQFDNQFEEKRVGPIKPWRFVAHTAQTRIFRSREARSLIGRPDRIEVFK